MSTHNLDLSGQRAVTATMNDPARTAVSTPSKQGDDVAITVSGCREIRVLIPPGARIERREYVTRAMVRDNNNVPVKKDGEYVYEDKAEERYVLVVAGRIDAFGRTSVQSDGDETEKVIEMYPHTSVVVRRLLDEHFTESGKLIEEFELPTSLA